MKRQILPKCSLMAAVCLIAASCGDDGGSVDGTAGTGTATVADTGGTGGGFEFASDEPDAYARVDRAGMPAVGTAVISSKDAYNQSNPQDDVDGAYVDEITMIVTAFHDALDDDLMTLGLMPCAPNDCIAQAAPLVVPDTLQVDPAAPAGFPNGRTLPDPVIDVTLAVVMLDLSIDGQTATTFAEVPVNPPANDVPFLTAFPYLAEPHQ